jgi:hypothetical protein
LWALAAVGYSPPQETGVYFGTPSIDATSAAVRKGVVTFPDADRRQDGASMACPRNCNHGSLRTGPSKRKDPHLRDFVGSGGGIRTRDLRVMRSPEPPLPKPVAA